MSAYGYDWHQTTVGRVEAAQRPLRLNEAAAIAALFEIPLESLMFASDARQPEEIDAEIEGLRRVHENGMTELADLRGRRKALESELEDARERERTVHAAMIMARTRLEGLEEQYGRRPQKTFEERYGWRP